MNTLKKAGIIFLKGHLAILIFSVIGLATIFTIQSCKKESNYNTKIQTNAFEINQFRNALTLAGKNLNTFSPNQRGANPPKEIKFVNELEYPALALIKSYGVTEEEIIAELGSMDSAQIVLTAEAILHEEDLIRTGKTLSFFEQEDYHLTAMSLFGINSANAQTDTFGGCLADAIGITAAFEVIEQGVMGLGKKGVLKLLRKVGGKYLGFIGVALAAYDFADCMGWI